MWKENDWKHNQNGWIGLKMTFIIFEDFFKLNVRVNECQE